MSKLIVFVLVVVIAALSHGEECIERPCTRLREPVTVVDRNHKCHEFGNLCVLQNAIRCRRVDPEICFRGTCRSGGNIIPCLEGVVPENDIWNKS